jgi:hypothetical protein
MHPLEFHNVAEMPAAPGGGEYLARFPQALWNATDSPVGPLTIRHATGCEIRFVTDAPRGIRLWLRPAHGYADMTYVMGNHVLSPLERLEEGKLTCLQIQPPALEPNRDPAVRRLGGFAPHVFRIYFHAMSVVFHGVDCMGGSLRPPRPDEKPRLRWLAYGSSITQGSNYYNYLNAAAQMLEADPLNLGMGGSCFLENNIADFIAARTDWDFATLELGINMSNQVPGKNETFIVKVEYLLREITRRHPGKPIFLITIFGNGVMHELEASGYQKDQIEKNEILRAAAERYRGKVQLIDGKALVPDFRGFKPDLIHPDAFGAARMGLNLADALRRAQPAFFAAPKV